ncbi:MAG: hypothetical protein R2942_14870 [Ignavibacteria bacterium]
MNNWQGLTNRSGIKVPTSVSAYSGKILQYYGDGGSQYIQQCY